MKRIATAALAVFALAAILPITAKADEPANPAQGAVKKLYAFRANGRGRDLTENFVSLAGKIKDGREVPYVTEVDTDSEFKSSKDSHRSFGMWTGFIKRSSGGMFTFSFSAPRGSSVSDAITFSCWINGAQVVSGGYGTVAVSVVLNAGYNSFCLIEDATNRRFTTISYKKQDSLKEPKKLTPGDLWHEDEPDDEDEDDE